MLCKSCDCLIARKSCAHEHHPFHNITGKTAAEDLASRELERPSQRHNFNYATCKKVDKLTSLISCPESFSETHRHNILFLVEIGCRKTVPDAISFAKCQKFLDVFFLVKKTKKQTNKQTKQNKTKQKKKRKRKKRSYFGAKQTN